MGRGSRGKGHIAPTVAVIVWERDNGLCQLCGRKLTPAKVTFDHIVPRREGGNDSVGNIRLACAECNNYRCNSPKRLAERQARYWEKFHEANREGGASE